MLLIYLSIAWIAGIFPGSKFALPPLWALAGFIPLTFILLLRRYQKLIVTTRVCPILLLSGAACYHLRLPISEMGALQSYNGRGTVEIQGRVARDSSLGETIAQLPLEAESITLQGASRNLTGTVLLFPPRFPVYSYDDILPPDRDDENRERLRSARADLPAKKQFGPEAGASLQKGMDDLKAGIDEERRQVILKIKNHYWKHCEYRKTLYNVDIYQAVIDRDIKSAVEFAKWLEENKGIK